MCGICGIYGLEDAGLTRKMVSVLKHRGPDDNGVFTDNKISLGHTRLSIIDLSERGRQPMCNEEGDIWLSFNGEIYNFKKLRQRLEHAGHRFSSQSDSEVILHSYEEYGSELVNQFNGMFAFALFDSNSRKLILARDGVGKKPLYYYKDEEKLIFASEIKAILKAGIKPEVSLKGLCSYLTYGYTIGNRTLFKHVKKLLPGYTLTVTEEEAVAKQFWNINERKTQADEGYYIKALRSLLEQSAERMMVADVPVGAFLSGGIDSTAVVALARPFARGQFHTFSAFFETVSELDHAKISSDYLDTVHHEVFIDEDTVRANLREIVWHNDEPLGDPAAVANYYLSKEAKKHVKVVLAGEGGDELFAGYPDYKTFSRISWFFKIPARLRWILKGVAATVPGKHDFYSRGYPLHKALTSLCQPNLQHGYLYASSKIEASTLKRMTTLDCAGLNNRAIFSAAVRNPLNKLLAVDFQNQLPEFFLMRGDKLTMANSIEERLPLLDKNVVEFAWTIPTTLKLRGSSSKYIFKEAVKDLMPKTTLQREKKGFLVPVEIWLSKGLRDSFDEVLDNGMLINQIFKGKQKNKLLEKFKRNRTDPLNRRLWNIYALELWHSVFINPSRSFLA